MRSLGYRTDLAIRVGQGSTVADRGGHLIVRDGSEPGLLVGELPAAGDGSAGIGDGRLAGAVRRRLPAAGHRVFGVDVTDAAEMDDAVSTSAGLAADRGVVLTAGGVREPPHGHAAAVIRPLASQGDWRQSARLRAACAEQEPVPEDQQFARLRAAARQRMAEAGTATWFGAFARGRLVAQLGVVPLPGRLARFQDVETHPAARRQGLAGTLVWAASRFSLDKLGAARPVIVADLGSAGRVYQSVGFTAAEDHIGFVRPP